MTPARKEGGIVKLGLTVARDRAIAYAAFHPLRTVAMASALLAAPGIVHMAFFEHAIPNFDMGNSLQDVAGKVVDGAGLIFGGAAVATGAGETVVTAMRRKAGYPTFREFLETLEK